MVDGRSRVFVVHVAQQRNFVGLLEVVARDLWRVGGARCCRGFLF